MSVFRQLLWDYISKGWKVETRKETLPEAKQGVLLINLAGHLVVLGLPAHVGRENLGKLLSIRHWFETKNQSWVISLSFLDLDKAKLWTHCSLTSWFHRYFPDFIWFSQIIKVHVQVNSVGLVHSIRLISPLNTPKSLLVTV